MIEKFLIGLGLRCGTIKNFNTVICNDMEFNNPQMWYFLTPIKSKDNGSGYKTAIINVAFPILAIDNDINELSAISRISEFEKEPEKQLIDILRKFINVPESTFSVIPFWAGEKLAERDVLKKFGNVSIHIINGIITVKYRESYFN